MSHLCLITSVTELQLHFLFIHDEILDYVEEIFNVMVNMDEEAVEAACNALVKMTPAPMNTMLEKQSKEEAIRKMSERKEKVVVDVPPTGEGKI